MRWHWMTLNGNVKNKTNSLDDYFSARMTQVGENAERESPVTGNLRFNKFVKIYLKSDSSQNDGGFQTSRAIVDTNVCLFMYRYRLSTCV